MQKTMHQTRAYVQYLTLRDAFRREEEERMRPLNKRTIEEAVAAIGSAVWYANSCLTVEDANVQQTAARAVRYLDEGRPKEAAATMYNLAFEIKASDDTRKQLIAALLTVDPGWASVDFTVQPAWWPVIV